MADWHFSIVPTAPPYRGRGSLIGPKEYPPICRLGLRLELRSEVWETPTAEPFVAKVRRNFGSKGSVCPCKLPAARRCPPRGSTSQAGNTEPVPFPAGARYVEALLHRKRRNCGCRLSLTKRFSRRGFYPSKGYGHHRGRCRRRRCRGYKRDNGATAPRRSGS